jgi:hypothetical protein
MGRDVPPPSEDGWVKVRCFNPDHADNDPSCSVHLESGGWKCWGCGRSGNIVELVMMAKGLPQTEARDWLSTNVASSPTATSKPTKGNGQTSTELALAPEAKEREFTLQEIEENLAQAQKFTREYPDAGRWFRNVMGIGLPTVERFGLAYYKGDWGDVFRGLRILFPVRDEGGKLLTVLGYNPKKQPKILPLRKGMGSHLFPLDQLPKEIETILIVEGLRDCVIAYEHGLVAVTGTAGAGCFKQEWVTALRNRGVKQATILYDHDAAGEKGAAKVATQLALVGIQTFIAKWPEGSPPKFDLADWFASGRTVEELHKEVLEKAEPYRADVVRRSSHILKYGELTIIAPDATIPRCEMADILAGTLCETGVFYTRGEDIWFVAPETAFPILDRNRLAGAVDGLVEFASFEINDSVVDSEGRPSIEATYYDPPFDLFKRVLYSPALRGKFPRLTLYTQNPQFDKSFRLIPPGYHRETGIYYAGPALTPAEGMNHIETMCREFAWKDRDTDLTHFMAALLTTMLAVHFVGDHPAFVLYGNQCSLGKTLLAKLCARIVTGRTAPSITYTSNDEEFEKRIATEVDKGGSVILIDNVKTPVIESDVLERCLTDDDLNFRRLCTNQSITAPNTVVFFFTMNNGSLCRDLATRSIQVNLYYEGDATKKVYQNKDLVGYVLEHRWEILAELAGMVTRFAEAGCPVWTGENTRFPKWCEIIGGILEHSGFKRFLGNMDEMESATSDDRDDIIKLGVRVYEEDKADTDLLARELVEMCRSAEAFTAILSRSKSHAAISLARQLARFKDETLRVEDNVSFTFRIGEEHATHKKLYRFEFRGELPKRIGNWKRNGIPRLPVEVEQSIGFMAPPRPTLERIEL